MQKNNIHLPRQELKVKKKARKINGLQTLEGRIYTQFTRKIKMFFGAMTWLKEKEFAQNANSFLR